MIRRLCPPNHGFARIRRGHESWRHDSAGETNPSGAASVTSRPFRFFPLAFSPKHFLSAIACVAAMLAGIPGDARAAAFAIDNAFDYPSGGPTLGDGHGCNLRRALQNSFTNSQGAGTECPAGDPAGDTITFSVATINQGAAGVFPFISG